MSTAKQALVATCRVALVGAAFFACFAAAIPIVLITSRLLPTAHFAVHVLPIVPIMGLANRFVLSPLEYHLNVKTFQYDSWYERRKAKHIAQPRAEGDAVNRAP